MSSDLVHSRHSSYSGSRPRAFASLTRSPTARRSAQARAKDAAKHTPAGLPASRYRDLLSHLSTLDRQTTSFAGQRIEKLTTPTPVQARAFELLGTAAPLALK